MELEIKFMYLVFIGGYYYCYSFKILLVFGDISVILNGGAAQQAGGRLGELLVFFFSLYCGMRKKVV